MTTANFTGEPTITQVLLRKAMQRLEAKNDRRLLGERASAPYQVIVRLMLTLAGFTCLTIAAFTLYTAAGFAMAGISCFVLAWLATPSTNVNNASTMDGR
ncbi:MAG TPA: hypothetical protein VIY48_10960 [Candidatus Paceibacterota bacterium]